MKPHKHNCKGHTTPYIEPDPCQEGKLTYTTTKTQKGRQERKRTHPNSADTIPLGATTDRQDHTREKFTLPTAHARTLTMPPHAHNHEEEMKTNHRLAHFCILRKEKGEGRKRVSEAGGAAAASLTASVENAPYSKAPREKERRALLRE